MFLVYFPGLPSLSCGTPAAFLPVCSFVWLIGLVFASVFQAGLQVCAAGGLFSNWTLPSPNQMLFL